MPPVATMWRFSQVLGVLPIALAFCAHFARSQTVEKVMSSEQMRGIHDILDKDGDGQASLAEGMAYVEKHRKLMSLARASHVMEVMDIDKDLRVSSAELEKDLEHWEISTDEKRKLKKKFRSLDLDDDGMLDGMELPIFFCYAFAFKSSDSDGNGVLHFEEWLRSVQKNSKNQKESAEAAEAIRKEGEAIFQKLDANGNSKLSLQEFFAYESGIFAAQEALRKLFEVADLDTDTHLSVDELVEVRGSPKFHNTNAYYHLKDWIKHEEL